MTMRLFLMCCELFVAMLCHHVECSDWGTGLFCVVVVVTGDNFPLLHSTAFWNVGGVIELMVLLKTAVSRLMVMARPAA